jgi:hypothetical protein
VRAHALHRQHAAGDLGHGQVAVRRSKPPGIANLPAGIAIKARPVQHHIDGIASLRRRNANAILHNGQNLGILAVSCA